MPFRQPPCIPLRACLLTGSGPIEWVPYSRGDGRLVLQGAWPSPGPSKGDAAGPQG